MNSPLDRRASAGSSIDKRVVGGAIDLGDIDAALPGRERRDLPIRQMSRKQDHPPVAGNRALDMLEAAHLDPPVAENADTAQMRILGGDPAEIVPHAADDALDFGGRPVGEGGGEIAAGLRR